MRALFRGVLILCLLGGPAPVVHVLASTPRS
jgi:hypothetical protein